MSSSAIPEIRKIPFRRVVANDKRKIAAEKDEEKNQSDFYLNLKAIKIKILF